MRHRLLAAALVLIATWGIPSAFAGVANAQHGVHAHEFAQAHGQVQGDVRTAPWSKRALELAGRLPVQDGGRVKPLSTYASFTLLRLNGRRTVTTPDGETLGATAWLLDVLTDPARAATYPSFQVQDSAAVHALGLDVRIKKRRDRYTFDELQPGVSKLFELAHQWAPIPAGQRSSLQHQVVQLAEAVDLFLGLAGFLDFAQLELPLPADGSVRTLFGGANSIRYSQLVARGPEVAAHYRSWGASSDPLDRESVTRLDGVLRLASDLGRASTRLAVLPPAEPVTAQPDWWTPGEWLHAGLGGRRASAAEFASLEALEGLARATAGPWDPARVEAALGALLAQTEPLAAARGETRRLDLEIRYYRLKPLHWSLVAFLLAFTATVWTWLRPAARFAQTAATGLATVGLVLLTFAIVLRCIIRERPPVSTLYETVLFVTACGVALGLVIEWIDRRRISGALAVGLGVVGLFLANGYETLERRDTMPSLVAVLDTNFWLATHVTTIVIGYAAALFAAFLGSVYLIWRVVRGDRMPRDRRRALTRMTYGAVAFGLIFSLVGTILGGIWANDSWGRFWGWDPKENGALLICIGLLAILHGKASGLLREVGIAACAAFTGTIVAFSWWGTNLLGVGLHSYGFTSGVHGALWTYYLLQWSVCGLGPYLAWRASRTRSEGSPEAVTTLAVDSSPREAA